MNSLRYYINLLNEAKPENINQPKLNQLFSTYQQRDINDTTLEQKYTSGLEIAVLLYRYSGPKNFLWVVNQYIRDQRFFLHDLPQWKTTLDEFDKIILGKTQINKDITSYKNINELRKAIASVKNQAGGSKFYDRAINAIDEFAKKDQARWLYRSNDYSIYQPLTFESSNICKNFNLSLNICSILSRQLYNTYSNDGTLIYIIDQRKIFICFVSKDINVKDSEFCDEQNNHNDYDLEWQLNKFPALKNILREVDTNDLDVIIKVEPNKKIIYKIAFDAIEKDTMNLYQVPEELRDRKMCLTAVKNNGDTLRSVPNELRDREMCLTAVSNYGVALKDVPLNLRDREMCLTAVNNIGYALRFVPEELRDREIYLTAVSRNGQVLRIVPEELRDLEMCLTAVKENGLAFADVPTQLQPEILKALRKEKTNESLIRLKQMYRITS
jgi:hypothetical protein